MKVYGHGHGDPDRLGEKIRKEAELKGEMHYFTGRPCVNGHVDFRRVTDKRCLTCCRVQAKSKYLRKIEHEHRESKVQGDAEA